MTLDLSEFTPNIKKVRNAARGGSLGDAALAGVLVLREGIKANIRKNKLILTSALLNSWLYGKGNSSGTIADAWTGTPQVYARIHEFGGVIRPKNAKALVFQIDGHWVVTQKVTMPARPYVRPALDSEKNKVGNAIIREISRHI